MIYMIWIIIIPLVLMVFYVISIYNFFVSSKARIKASIQEIGNQLKRQAELIPNLVTSAKGYLKHEKGIFDKLTEARKSIDRAIESGDVQKMSDAGGKLAEILPGLKVVVESNPEIKGAEVVTKLMEDLRDTSDKVMYARRLLIDLSADYNVKRVSFPSNIIASMFKFEEVEGLKTPEGKMEVKESEMQTPKAEL
ncbi:MAG: LemA family protein [Candidatus Woesebacteria bacterium GW2011_GWB1_38_5]|uniref:LemA family protein n=3 Tax=Candidatus Woeseibacteriota TaxID=1752722 RepID=A0A0G0NFZ4_9BACT|nr:MAG: LemA family protein [Candidatus Woesebacteria bacterium GW2011_GWD1_38_10]KKQ75433.1 MAG: LemA family protein [Candidatus Woesebacteria bacterium GW2011_GWB1_38_5]KKQ84809.1 MAG: LemA family protein [Candidatus Woesebacteria bacterium GW2011_GWA1_38_8]